MKKYLAIVVIVFAAMLAWRTFVFRRPESPMKIREARMNALQKSWLGARHIALSGPGFPTAVHDMVRTNRTALSAEEGTQLCACITRWGKELHSGTYEDYLSFRKPESYQFEENQLGYVSKKLYGDENQLRQRSDAEKFKTLFEWHNTLRFDAVAESSLSLEVRVLEPFLYSEARAKSSGINPFAYYPAGMLDLGAFSPVRYRTGPADVLKKHKAVKWVSFKAAFISKQDKGEALPVQIAAYWSPDDREWRPSQCFLTVPKARNEQGRTPTIFF